jgi:hypothetical protein
VTEISLCCLTASMLIGSIVPPIPLPNPRSEETVSAHPSTAAAPSPVVNTPPLTSAPGSVPAKPPTDNALPKSNTTSNATPAPLPLNAQVDAYIHGEDLDRTQLYQSWNQVTEYVAQGLRTAVQGGSPLAGRYLNLIANALNVIDNGKYLAPTVRPNWDQSIKSERLAKSNGISGFQPDDYKAVVNLLCSANSANRNAAQRLLRQYPSDNLSSYSSCIQAD